MIGDNGILTQSQQASIKTAKSAFKERANMILAEMYSEELTDKFIIAGENEFEKNLSRLAVLASRMENEIEFKAPAEVEYQISSVTIGNENENTPLLVPSDSSKGTKTITVTVSPKEGASYYAKIQGSYYPITLTNTSLTLGTVENVNTGNNQIPTVQANAQNSKVSVSAVQDTTNNLITTITLSGKGRNQNLGNETINLYLPGKENSTESTEKRTVSVKVGAIYTVKVEAEFEENSTTSRKGTITSPSLKTGEVYAEGDYLEDSIIILSAIPKENSNYQLKGWFIGETELNEIEGADNQYRLPIYNNGLTIDNDNKINIMAKFDSHTTLADMFDASGMNENKIHIGDWVNYTAGNWDSISLRQIENSGAKIPASQELSKEAYTFGGIMDTMSRNKNVYNSSSYVNEINSDGSIKGTLDGWRVFDINTVDGEDQLVLISAGCPESFGKTYGASAQNMQFILAGVQPNEGYSITGGYTQRDWSMYENVRMGAVSSSAVALTLEDLNDWSSKYVAEGKEIRSDEVWSKFHSDLVIKKYRNLIYNGSNYWLATACVGDLSHALWVAQSNGGIGTHNGWGSCEMGVRLKLNITGVELTKTNNIKILKYSSYDSNTYTYACWDIQPKIQTSNP